ncbi:MAG TPA: DUF502 domain-containing protein [Verrucomicrobiae bacterium]|nr:DUF502 domain-containing protein [Verrucomicrobiae bacterium]
MNKSFFARWRASFFTGLAVAFPAIVSIAAIAWLFSTVSSFTDLLLFFLPHEITHQGKGLGPTFWYWKLAAILLAIVLITAIGVLARYYIGKRIIEWMDNLLMHVPLLNKFYGAIKQVNDAFAGNKNSFKTVVLVEFPLAGTYSIGFITNDQNEMQNKTGGKTVCVFVPTTPNPTAGFLLIVPVEKVTKLDMSVGEGLKYIVSLGSISPEYLPPKIK